MGAHGLDRIPLFGWGNRLNVAVSRARCLAYVVASPRLLETSCRTVEQMRLLNALCRFVEVADGYPGDAVSDEKGSG